MVRAVDVDFDEDVVTDVDLGEDAVVQVIVEMVDTTGVVELENTDWNAKMVELVLVVEKADVVMVLKELEASGIASELSCGEPDVDGVFEVVLEVDELVIKADEVVVGV